MIKTKLEDRDGREREKKEGIYIKRDRDRDRGGEREKGERGENYERDNVNKQLV